MAPASAGALAGTSDLRLRPRLLLALLNDYLPFPDDDEAGPCSPRRPADLAYAADAVRAHGLLAEHDAVDPELLEEWRAAVDAWVNRLLGLMDSNREHNCWVGTSFLGLTFEECSDVRFVKCYSDWFQKVLGNMQTPSCIKMVSMSTCTSMHDLFVRLSTFSNLKNEANSLARKVIKPLLRLLDETSPVIEKAADLLGLLMKLFPSSVYRHFNSLELLVNQVEKGIVSRLTAWHLVESVITEKIMSGQYSLKQSKKLASTLALSPYVRISENSVSLMIQKILTTVNSMLNDTFFGIEEGHTDPKLLRLLAPPRSELVPPLGGQHILPTRESRAYVVHTISALIHCCSVMLTSSYPIKVTNIPAHALVTVIQKVLLIDGSSHKSLFQSNNLLYQEFICFEIPTLHSIFLDLLASIIKGIRSSLIPHASIVITLIAEYFKRAKLPSIRRKLYTIVRLLLSSMGIGMVMQLLQVVITNIFSDLDDYSASSIFSPEEATIGPSLKGSSNMEQRQQLQSKTIPSSESTSHIQMLVPLCVKIGALEALEELLNVGCSFRAYSWRTEMDQLLIDVATHAYFKAGMYDRKPPWPEDPSISDFQLASFKALLASFLSNPHERPPYLDQGLELFSRGKLETGTELGNFCSHALLALDALIRPRQLPPFRGAYSDLGGTEQSVLGSRTSQPPRSSPKRRATDDLGGTSCKSRPVSITTIEPTNAVEKHAPVELWRVQQQDAQCSHSININGEHPDTADGSCHHRQQYAASHTLGNPPHPADSLSVYPAPISVTTRGPRDHDEISNKSGCQGGFLSSDNASSGQNVLEHASPIIPAASVSRSEWDSVDPQLDLGDANVDSRHGL